MMRALASLSVALAAAGTGCMLGMVGHAAPAPPETQQASGMAPGGMGAMAMQACPVSVPGTQVAAAETTDGESITFKTSPDRVADLRGRVHAMADMHNRQYQGGGMEGMQGGMQHGGMMMSGGSMGSSGARADQMAMMPPPSHATVKDVDGGASIIVAPNDPADLDRLRSAVRMRADHMRESGTCEMGQPGRM